MTQPTLTAEEEAAEIIGDLVLTLTQNKWLSLHERIASALRSREAEAVKAEREACALVAETQHVSVVTLVESGVPVKKGPFTIQDEATRTCAASIAAAIRSRPHPEVK